MQHENESFVQRSSHVRFQQNASDRLSRHLVLAVVGSWKSCSRRGSASKEVDRKARETAICVTGIDHLSSKLASDVAVSAILMQINEAANVDGASRCVVI
uniref:Uncharacterized protein n=1 Tax=Peronospora matthiolae TaxID=2874970 RepID=A0AAV1T2J4_9STRA